jgi:hypothetical protein
VRWPNSVLASNTKSWKKAAPAIAKREANKIIVFIVFMSGYLMFVEFDGDNPPVKSAKQAI